MWALHITTGFALVYWGQGIRGPVNAFVLSGSSLTTLGIRTADEPFTLVLVVIEALIGLGLVGLVISYLPTIYSAYLDREIAVARLEVRAGAPCTSGDVLASQQPDRLARRDGSSLGRVGALVS